MAASKRELVLGLLKKLGATFDEKISEERAVKKLQRYLEEKGAPEDASDEEKGLLAELKVEGSEKAEAAPAAPAKEEEKPVTTEKKTEEKEKKEPKEKSVPAIQLMKQLLKDGTTDNAILKAFTKKYEGRGKTDAKWVETRVAIYRRLAEGKKPKAKAEAKPEKKDE